MKPQAHHLPQMPRSDEELATKSPEARDERPSVGSAITAHRTGRLGYGGRGGTGTGPRSSRNSGGGLPMQEPKKPEAAPLVLHIRISGRWMTVWP